MQNEITPQKIIEICNGLLLTSNIENKFNNFVIDSRKVKKGDCFVAIRGENNN